MASPSPSFGARSSTEPSSVSPEPGPSKNRALDKTGNGSKAKPFGADKVEVMELSSGSEDEAVVAKRQAEEESRKEQRRERYLAVRNAVPEVDPRVVMSMFTDPSYGGNPDLIVGTLLETNYRLKDGGWKYGYDPKSVLSDDDNGGRRNGNQDELVSTPERAGAASGGAARKPMVQKRVRVEPSEDEAEDDDEVDQLASDDDHHRQAQDSVEEDDITKEQAFERAGYWLDVEERGPMDGTYQKAALNQLFRDYAEYAENHIRDRFESELCGKLYAPTWFELHRLHKSHQLLKLKSGPRDMDAPIQLPDGTKRARKEIKPSRVLKKEKRWLEAYLDYGGRGLKVKKSPQASPVKRKKETAEQRRARLSKNKAQSQSKPKKKDAARRDTDDDENADSEAGTSDEDPAPIGKKSSAKGKGKGRDTGNKQKSKKRHDPFDSDDEADLRRGHPANSNGWGPGYQNKASTSSPKGKKSGYIAGSWATSSSGPFKVKEEEHDWFERLGPGRSLYD
ncbi:hypothetical protein BMF94_4248 [Rhodotorula taiwanensis]|uniref:Uncharacterized protein n=1 Tax=Rhodotorula taiwanensis TaxID=741276 RepID=A0A2S5B6K9_9BASI|nr:hypothetical protein BMF94_4248 [Rhodotorula taiwanensis]